MELQHAKLQVARVEGIGRITYAQPSHLAFPRVVRVVHYDGVVLKKRENYWLSSKTRRGEGKFQRGGVEHSTYAQPLAFPKVDLVVPCDVVLKTDSHWLS